MKCQGCEEEKKLIDSHIIPKSFFMDLRGEGNHLDVVGSESLRKGRSLKGEYDNEILGYECDSFFQTADDYAKKIFIDRESQQEPISRNNLTVGWRLKEFDYALFRQFSLSVMWRASISKRAFFNLVRLGPHEARIKSEIYKESEDKANYYEFWVSKFTSDKIPELEKTILNPDSIKTKDGINISRIYFSGYTIWVKIDKRKSQEEMNRVKVKDGEPLLIVSRNFGSSKEKQLILDMHGNLRT